LRRLPLLILALCGSVHAATPPNIDLTVTPAWKGWSRPGRSTEVDIRLRTDTATPATVEMTAGRHIIGTGVELQPGRSVRLQLPVSSAEDVSVSVGVRAGTLAKRDVAIAHSESPLLGSGLVSGDSVQLEGFHTVALTADDLPRHPSAYSSIDALILDGPTLRALDQHQLGALLAYISACGHVALVNTDARTGKLLDSVRGCSGQSLPSAASLAEATDLLESSLHARMPKPLTFADFDASLQTASSLLNRVAVAIALYFVATLLVLTFTTHAVVLLLVPALTAVAALALLHTMQPPAQLVIWSEGRSGIPMARYQAWQVFAGVQRTRMRVPIPPQLAAEAAPCKPTPAMRIDLDAGSAEPAFAEFDTRLFHQVSLCYSGSFPVSRAISIETRADGALIVRNSGAKAWPEGALLADGLVHHLPALEPGAAATLAAKSGQAPGDAVHRMAMMRTEVDGAAALWPLELGGVAGIPVDSNGWLLVSVPAP
jgi:hypothetical protein